MTLLPLGSGRRYFDNFGRDGRAWPPYVVRVELVEGCEMRCYFCGIRSVEGQRNYMLPATLEHLCRQMCDLRWEARLEFSMHGEPMLHPQLEEMLAIGRRHYDRSCMVLRTGGGTLRTQAIAQVVGMFEAGLNVLVVGKRPGSSAGRRLRDDRHAIEELHPGIQWRTDGADKRYMRYSKIVVVEEEPVRLGTLDNQAGLAYPPNNSAMHQPCDKPHKEMAVRWDGTIVVCDADWRGEYVCGTTESLEAAWESAAYRAARYYLARGWRRHRPCQGCDRTPLRVADPRGGVQLDRTDHLPAIETALDHSPLTPARRLPWEP